MDGLGGLALCGKAMSLSAKPREPAAVLPSLPRVGAGCRGSALTSHSMHAVMRPAVRPLLVTSSIRHVDCGSDEETGGGGDAGQMSPPAKLKLTAHPHRVASSWPGSAPVMAERSIGGSIEGGSALANAADDDVDQLLVFDFA